MPQSSARTAPGGTLGGETLSRGSPDGPALSTVRLSSRSSRSVEAQILTSGRVGRVPLPSIVSTHDPVLLVGLQIVVPVAQPDQVGQAGLPPEAEGFDVIDLQPVP